MYFNSLTELIEMAGHGKYVWGCVLVSSLLIWAIFAVARRKFTKQHKLNVELDRLPK